MSSFDPNAIVTEIHDQYLEDDHNRPWIVGFSGGKDSTMLLQLVWYAVKQIPSELRRRKIYVVCNNTLVENPKIIDYVENVLDLIQESAFEQSMPISVHRTTPNLEDSFWVNLIGKGYPAPNNMFRWCTERLKIKPTTKFILEKINEAGEAIILLGTRRDESSSRAASINKHNIKGNRLSKHPLPNAYAFTPIKEVTTDQVWMYLQQVKSPWKANNKILVTLYRNASGGDCPIVMDLSTPSCGKSRFGCWVCTVVDKDKSMEALVDNGESWLLPLLDIRDELADTIDRRNPNYDWTKYRMNRRRNGAEGPGPYHDHVRKRILSQVLKAQKEIQVDQPDTQLITYQELVAIQVLWYRDNIFNYKVADIYNEVFGKQISLGDQNDNLAREKELLREACKENPDDFTLIHDLLELQRTKVILMKKRGLHNDLEKKIDRFVDKTGN